MVFNGITTHESLAANENMTPQQYSEYIQNHFDCGTPIDVKILSRFLRSNYWIYTVCPTGNDLIPLEQIMEHHPTKFVYTNLLYPSNHHDALLTVYPSDTHFPQARKVHQGGRLSVKDHG